MPAGRKHASFCFFMLAEQRNCWVWNCISYTDSENEYKWIIEITWILLSVYSLKRKWFLLKRWLILMACYHIVYHVRHYVPYRAISRIGNWRYVFRFTLISVSLRTIDRKCYIGENKSNCDFQSERRRRENDHEHQSVRLPCEKRLQGPPARYWPPGKYHERPGDFKKRDDGFHVRCAHSWRLRSA